MSNTERNEMIKTIKADMSIKDDTKLALLYLLDPDFRAVVSAEVWTAVQKLEKTKEG